MTFKDWIGYLIHRLVDYMETPRGERKAIRLQRKEKWSHRWFGMVPFSMKMYVDKQRHRMRRRLKR